MLHERNGMKILSSRTVHYRCLDSAYGHALGPGAAHRAELIGFLNEERSLCKLQAIRYPAPRLQSQRANPRARLPMRPRPQTLGRTEVGQPYSYLEISS